MRAADVRAALAKKFAQPAYAIFWEVGEGTGAAGGRYADAVAMSLWPSRGCELAGFEIKVSRSDWLGELKKPEKSAPIQRFMDRWWVITPPGIVHPGELPPTWGLYEVKGSGIHCVTQAPKLAAEPPAPPFLAALLRRAHEHSVRAIKEGIDAAMAGERAAIGAEVNLRVEEETRHRRAMESSAQEKLKRIQEAAGLEPEKYLDADAFGRAVGLVHRLGITQTYHGIEQAARQAQRFANEFSALMPAEVG